jgi:signal transduction histidine kinase
MKKNKDPRINVGNTSIKEYFLLFWILAALNGFHMWIYQEFYSRGLLETNVHFVINFLMIYLLVAAAGITGLVAFVRRISWSRPMRKLSEAASKIAKGDFSVRIAPLRKDGKKDYVEVMFDDFNTMAHELASIEALKNDFIANVSHEIKTPLSVIQGYAAALQNEALTPEECKEYSGTIFESTQKLTKLVSNILKLNKLENQEIVSEVRPFDLGEQLRRCAAGYEELWEQKNVRFEADIDEVSVCYDSDMLEIVWNNLLSNAIKFTGPGGSITLSVKVQNGLDNDNAAHGRYARVSLTDTGIGIDSDVQKHIFDKFYQEDTSHSGEGNGLGLALVKRTMDLLGGTITVESQPGQGSVFTVCLKI